MAVKAMEDKTRESSLPEFRNEPFTNFSRPENRSAMQAAVEKVRGQLGREYDLIIGGEKIRTAEKFCSYNPSRKDEVVGVFQKCTPELAARAVKVAHENFPRWAKVPAEQRAATLLKASEILRRRKFEMAAWMVFEVGKSWAEADGDVAEALDFCEFYAREMLRLAGPQPITPVSG